MIPKKITEKQFVLDCINKEFELININIKFDNFDRLIDFAKKNYRWMDKYFFTESQDKDFKEYFLNHFYDWKPKRIPRKIAENAYSWFVLSYGFIVKDKSNGDICERWMATQSK